MRIWLDVGDRDSLGAGTASLAKGLKAAGLPVIFNQWPGLHKEPYWMEHTTDYLNFYTLPWSRPFPVLNLGETFAALQYRNDRLWFVGQLVSLIGTWMQTTAQGFLIIGVVPVGTVELP